MSQRLGVFVVLGAIMLGGSAPAYADYTELDVDAAMTTADLKAIADDATTDEEVRWKAVAKLPSKEAVAYLDSPLQSNVHRPLSWQGEWIVREALLDADALPLNQYGRTVWLLSTVGTRSRGVRIQRQYVEKLIAAGQVDEALGEARRLYGITPLNSVDLSATVNVITVALKAKAIKDGKGLKGGIAAVNEYLTAVQTGKASEHPFAKIAVPPSPANVAVLETSGLESRYAIWPLLYACKHDEANARADAFLQGTGAGTLQAAIELKALAINGKAASPVAANEFFDSLK